VGTTEAIASGPSSDRRGDDPRLGRGRGTTKPSEGTHRLSLFLARASPAPPSYCASRLVKCGSLASLAKASAKPIFPARRSDTWLEPMQASLVPKA